MKKILTVIMLMLFTASVLCAGEAGARASGKKEKKVKYVRSKDGLQALIELGRKNREMEKELEGETSSYGEIRDALDEGRLEKGETAADIVKKYGEPVIVLSGEKEGGQKWVYKPAQASFWSDEKVYLLFDEKGELEDWYLPRNPGTAMTRFKGFSTVSNWNDKK